MHPSTRAQSGAASERGGLSAVLLAAALAAAALAVGIIVFGLVQEEAAHASANPSPDPGGAIAAGTDDPVDWEYWLSENPDIVAWLRIPGTSVDQPLFMAPADDPTFYLSHDAHRAPSAYGSCYVDAGCAQGMDSFNVMVFGHNVSSPPEVLHDVEGYADESYAREHRDIVVFTPSGSRYYEVVAADVVAGNEPVKRTDFEGASDYWDYRNERVSAARVRLEDGGEFSKLMTICTCSYHENPVDERTLVYARLVGG